MPLDELTAASVAHQPRVDDDIERRQQFARLNRVIFALPPRCRQVFVRHKICGCSQAEIADDLGISVNAVEKLIIRGMRRCRAELAPELAGASTH